MRPIELAGLSAEQLDHLERTLPAGWRLDRIDLTDPPGRDPAAPVGYLRLPPGNENVPVTGLVPWLVEALSLPSSWKSPV